MGLTALTKPPVTKTTCARVSSTAPAMPQACRANAAGDVTAQSPSHAHGLPHAASSGQPGTRGRTPSPARAPAPSGRQARRLGVAAHHLDKTTPTPRTAQGAFNIINCTRVALTKSLRQFLTWSQGLINDLVCDLPVLSRRSCHRSAQTLGLIEELLVHLAHREHLIVLLRVPSVHVGRGAPPKGPSVPPARPWLHAMKPQSSSSSSSS
mmetsp:Transcript_71144/g.231063  ORF Transcript_71144/g.231063 Transcript_71144/m.231063 type:complete len:209 (-) Transcript_71144:188-814(-)